MCALFMYLDFSIKRRKYFSDFVLKTARVLLLLLFWVFYMPFFETFTSIFDCVDGFHAIDTSMRCYSGAHIFYVALSVLVTAFLFVLNFVVALLYNETQPVPEDALSRLESTFEVMIVCYRSLIAMFSYLCTNVSCPS